MFINFLWIKTITYEEIELKSVKNNFITEKSTTLYRSLIKHSFNNISRVIIWSWSITNYTHSPSSQVVCHHSNINSSLLPYKSKVCLFRIVSTLTLVITKRNKHWWWMFFWFDYKYGTQAPCTLSRAAATLL